MVASVCWQPRCGTERMGDRSDEDESNKPVDSGAGARGGLLWAGLATEAQAQQVVYYYSTPAPPIVYYSSDPGRIPGSIPPGLPGSSWYWSPALGWHTHTRYIDVPYWAPTTRVYPQPSSVPTITTYYAR